jgi:hypothetical protein
MNRREGNNHEQGKPESAFWLELIMEHGLLAEKLVRPLHAEAGELTAIMAASRISASRNIKRPAMASGQPPIRPQSAIGNRQSAI